jgi:apolipoprotein N-acyltransferase
MQRYLRLSQTQRTAHLIIWPETAIPLFHHQAPEFLELLAEERQRYGIDFLVGIPVMETDGRYFNSVMNIDAHPNFYYKRHLVPFGEYIPFQSSLGNLLHWLNVPLSEFSAGTFQQPNLPGAQQVIGISICYEDVFGELIRTSLPQATLLVNVSNDAWFGDSIAPHQHLEIARMRALETGRYLLRATNTGISALIDAKGKVTARAPQFEIYALRGQAQPYHGTTPYVRFGNRLVITLLILCVIIGSFIHHSPHRQPV